MFKTLMSHCCFSSNNLNILTMAFDYQGDIQEITTEQLNFVSKILKDRGFKPCRVFVEQAGNANMVANIKRFIVNDEKGEFKFIAKIAPSSELLRMSFNTMYQFKNEHIMYSEILPKMQQTQSKSGIPTKDGFRFATCFGSCIEAPNEILLLEDLETAHFVPCNREEPMSNEYMKLVLKRFADFHALSYKLKQDESQSYAALKNSLTDLWALSDNLEESLEYFGEFEKDVLSILDNDKYKKVLDGIVSQIPNFSMDLNKSDGDSKFSVIQQCDSSAGNIMFRFEGQRPVESILINYQSARVASPIGDILYMIYNSTDHKTRSKYFREWIEYYYTELDKVLTKYGLKIDSVYPKEQLNLDLGRYSKLILGLSVFASNTLIRKPEAMQKIKMAVENNNMTDLIEAFKLSNLDANSKAIVKSKIEGCIDTFIEFGS